LAQQQQQQHLRLMQQDAQSLYKSRTWDAAVNSISSGLLSFKQYLAGTASSGCCTHHQCQCVCSSSLLAARAHTAMTICVSCCMYAVCGADLTPATTVLHTQQQHQQLQQHQRHQLWKQQKHKQQQQLRSRHNLCWQQQP
jgi:hypothetical protein